MGYKVGDIVEVIAPNIKLYLCGVGLTGTAEVVDNSNSHYLTVKFLRPGISDKAYGLIEVREDAIRLVTPALGSIFNSQAEVWQYLLSGGKVSTMLKQVVGMENNQLVHIQNGQVADLTFINYKLYSKYIEPAKWYENIPKQGILCVTSQIEDGKESLTIITGYDGNGTYPFRTKKGGFRFARPATPEEAATLIYQPEPRL